MPLTNEQKKAYRSIGHQLSPVVTIAGQGLTEGLLNELNRALDDHELIKVKIAAGDREQKKQLVAQMIQATETELVQQIGNVALILRRNPYAKPNLSNLHRHQQS
jgi:RNA-binding protein